MSIKKLMKNHKKMIIGIIILLFATAVIVEVNLVPASWFMPTKYVKVTDTSIEYYVGVSGNCWTTTLKDPSGIAINTQKGCSYGTHSFPRPEAEGTYKICILPDYKPSSYVECEPVFVPAKKCSDNTLYNSCSITKPQYCDSTGILINNPSLCGCPTGLILSGDTCTIPAPISGEPSMSLSDIISQILNWIKSLFGM